MSLFRLFERISYYIVAKRLGARRAHDAARYLLNVLAVIPVNGDDCVCALNLPIPDFEDALATVCSGKAAVEYIITNDKEFLAITGISIKIMSPAGFLCLPGLA